MAIVSTAKAVTPPIHAVGNKTRPQTSPPLHLWRLYAVHRQECLGYPRRKDLLLGPPGESCSFHLVLGSNFPAANQKNQENSMEKFKIQFPSLIERTPDKFLYMSWKINRLVDGTWEAVRINPTKYFRASSLYAALKAITRRESELQGMPKQKHTTCP